jgi:hypothetical protein
MEIFFPFFAFINFHNTYALPGFDLTTPRLKDRFQIKKVSKLGKVPSYERFQVKKGSKLRKFLS